MKKHLLCAAALILSVSTIFGQTPETREIIAAENTAIAAPEKESKSAEFVKTNVVHNSEKVEDGEFPAVSNSAAKKQNSRFVDYHKFEFFAGYSFNRIDTGFDRDSFGPEQFDPTFRGTTRENLNTNGFTVAATGNINRYFGIKADFSAHERKGEIITGLPASLANDQKYRLYNLMGGVQVKDNVKDGKRIKPFGHIMVGGAFQKFTFNNSLQNAIEDAGLETSRTQFAAILGGGVDVRLSRRVDLRLIQLDYNPIFERDPEQPEPIFESDRIAGRVQNNFRISIGFVFH